MEQFAWLKDQGSLTRALIDACDGCFSVDLMSQGWGGALASERRLLNMGAGETALLREVKLKCRKKVWVFARTLIPSSSLTGRARQLAHLGSKPLGAVLFADPTTRRRTVEIARIGPRHALFASAYSHLKRPHKQMSTELWGRRTLFVYAGKPILVNEIFLPGMPSR